MSRLSGPLVRALVLYLVLFYGIWTLNELCIAPRLAGVLGEGSVLYYVCVDCGIKNLVWTLPAFLLIGHFDEEMHIRRREMFTHPVPVGETVVLFAVFLAYILFSAWRANGGLRLYPEHFTECVAFIFVGLTEELVFRGWLLNALMRLGKVPALAITSVLFLCIHFPIWLAKGYFVQAFAGMGFLVILALGVLFGLVFLHWRNLWIPIAMHMLWDVCVTVLYP